MPPAPDVSSISVLNIGADLSADDVEFGKAMDRYKRERRRPYPTCSEVLAVLRSLGYRKAPCSPMLSSDDQAKKGSQ